MLVALREENEGSDEGTAEGNRKIRTPIAGMSHHLQRINVESELKAELVRMEKHPRTRRQLRKRAPLFDSSTGAFAGWSAYHGDTEMVAKRLGESNAVSKPMRERAAQRRSKAIYLDEVDRVRMRMDRERLEERHGVLDEDHEALRHADPSTKQKLMAKNQNVRKRIIADQAKAHLDEDKKHGGHYTKHAGKPKVKAAAQIWECKICTKHNYQAALRCVECNGRRPRELDPFKKEYGIAQHAERRARARKGAKKVADGFGRRRYVEDIVDFAVDDDYRETDGVAHDLMRRERKANENFIERTAVHGTKCKSCGGKIDLSSAWYKAPDHPRTYKFCKEVSCSYFERSGR